MAKYGSFKYSKKKYGINLERWITDRNQEDVEADNERVYINYWDLNRIETRTQELISCIPESADCYEAASDLKTKTDWETVTPDNYDLNMPMESYDDFETDTDRIISNILRLWNSVYDMNHSAYAAHYDKIPKSMNYLGIEDMNNLELALQYMYLKAIERGYHIPVSIFNVNFYNGTTLLQSTPTIRGETAKYTGAVPAKAGDGRLERYYFSGWYPSNTNIQSDIDCYAQFTNYPLYIVKFYSGNELLQTEENVIPGSDVEFIGDSPDKTGVTNPGDYEFTGWSPPNTNIQGDTSCYAQFRDIRETITDSWETIIASCADKSYSTRYSVGDVKSLDLGPYGVVAMQIIAMDTDREAITGARTPITWLSLQVLDLEHRMNPKLEKISSTNYTEGTGAVGGWEKCEMRKFLQENIKPNIPDVVKNAIKTVTKSQRTFATGGGTVTQTTQDDIWIPAYEELFNGNGLYRDTFIDDDSRRKISPGGNGVDWWTRSSSHEPEVEYFVTVGQSGGQYAAPSEANHAFAIGFCT